MGINHLTCLNLNSRILLCFCLFTLLSGASCHRNNKAKTNSNNLDLKSNLDTVPILPTSIVRNIKQDRKGTIWVTSWDGMFKYDGHSYINFTKDVSDARFFSVLEDRKGNYWFSTVGSGVYYFNGDSFQQYTTKDGLTSNVVMEMMEATDKTIWFSTENGVSKYDGHTFQNFSELHKLLHTEVYSIVEDHNGHIWFGTKEGIGIYDGEKISELKHEGKSFENVRIIIKDKNNHMWFGGNDGLWLYNDGQFKNYSTSFTGYIYQDHAGNILTSSTNQTTVKSIANNQQKSNFHSWKLSRYPINKKNEIDSIPRIIQSNEDMIFGILEDRDGVIWYGTLNGVKRIPAKN